MAMNPRLLRPRASGFNPKSITGLVGWWDAADASSVTLNGSSVSQLSDKSGGGWNATQGTAASQPAYVTAAVNGKNVVRFSAGTRTLTMTGASLSTSNTWLIVATPNSNGSSYLASGNEISTGGPAIISGYVSRAYEFFHTGGGNTDRLTIAETASGANVLAVSFTQAGAINTFFNGAAASTKATKQVSHTSLAMNFFSGNGSDLCEFLHWNKVLSATERAAVEKYLAKKWGVTLS